MYNTKSNNDNRNFGNQPKAEAFGNAVVTVGTKQYRLPKGLPLQVDRSLVERSLINKAKALAEVGETLTVTMEVTIVLTDKPEMEQDDLLF